jgi:hypothetical protein
MNSKQHLTLALIAAVLTTGILFQSAYDKNTAARKEIIRRNFREMKGFEINDGALTTMFFNVRKLRTPEEIDKRSRELVRELM